VLSLTAKNCEQVRSGVVFAVRDPEDRVVYEGDSVMAALAEHRDVDVVPAPHQVVATWPVGTFLENIVALENDDFVVSVHNHRELHTVNAAGAHSVWATMPVSPAGLIATGDAVFAVGGEPGQGPHRLIRVDIATREVTDLGPIPGSLFLNGFTPGPPGMGYAVDSLVGDIYSIELSTGDSHLVLQDPLLTKVSAEPMMPGANGIKRFGDALYITNTDRALVLRAALDSAGLPTGSVEIVAEHLRGDDLAVAEDGVLYIANHIHNTVIRFSPSSGERVAIAGPDQGMAGSTACIFGRTQAHGTSLFVTTTGGIVMPLDGIVQQAKLVRIDIGGPNTGIRS